MPALVEARREGARQSPWATVRGYVALTKPRIIELLLVTTLPAMVLARRGWPAAGLIVATLAGGTLAAGGANAANMYLDRDIDAVMRRTQGRPLVTGAVSPAGALAFSVALEVVAFVVLWRAVNLLSAVLAFGAAGFYVLVYTIALKRRSAQNIVIGGAAGAVPTLVGWSAVTGHLAWPAVVLFALVVAWTPSHFWALALRYRDDYGRAGVPMLPVVASPRRVATEILAYSAVLVALSLALAPVAHLGPLYLAVAASAGAVYLVRAVQLLVAEGSPGPAMRLFRYSISYVTVLFAGIALDVLVRVGLR